MTGPEHYREAERLLDAVAIGGTGQDTLLKAAHVHAMLAVAAATVNDVTAGPIDGPTWSDVVSS